MPTDRLARFRSWPSGVYTDELARLWRSQHPLRSRRLALPDTDAAVPEQRIALVCHVFYTDLLDELAEVLANAPAHSDLFVSVVTESDRAAVLAHPICTRAGRVDVRVVQNRGRDIAPKYVGFADVFGCGYDLMLFLHTKRSTHEEVGTPWRRHLLRELAGSRERVQGILRAFEADPALGVLAPEHFGAIANDTIWQGTFLYASGLARRMGFQVRRWAPPDFASGSMFWARPEALGAISDLRLTMQDFPPEARQVTATNMHALERLVFLAAEHRGYRSALLGDGTSSELGPAESSGVPPFGMWARAVPPTIRKMAADVEIRRKRFSPVRVLPLLLRRLQAKAISSRTPVERAPHRRESRSDVERAA